MKPDLAPLFEAAITVGAPLELGDAAVGRRRVIPITGGSFAGERLRGRILSGGADWQLIRPDGVAEIEARYTLETEEGALISVVNRGYRHGPPEVVAKLIRGEEVDPSAYYFRTVPVFETGAPSYAWLTRTVFVGIGIRRPDQVVLHVHEVL